MLAEWMVAGEPQNWSLVELGPGRGTLLKDILRVFAQFPRVLDSLSVHLVEASPTLSHTQEATLTGLLHTTFCTLSQHRYWVGPSNDCSQESRERWRVEERGDCFKSLPTRPVHWSQEFQCSGTRDWKMYPTVGLLIYMHILFLCMYAGHSYIIAHEFFDALPVHQFQVKTQSVVFFCFLFFMPNDINSYNS